VARFLVDAQLPPALAGWLVEQGHEAGHVFDAGLASADDPDVWSETVRRNAVLITKDENFLAIRSASRDGPSVVWLRIGNATNRALIDWLAPRFPAILAALGAVASA
jgi:predicted nuclease of predicted toxin-antitoxin system